MKRLFKCSVFGIGLLASGFANAALVTQWAYEVSSEWLAASFVAGGGGSLGSQTVTTSEISWGASGGTYTGGSPNRSALIISNSPASGNDMVTNSLIPALTNVITHFNNTISNTFMTLAGAQLKTSLKLKPFLPIEAPGFFPAKVIEFTIKFIETPNGANCGFPSASLCDDIFVIELGNLTSDFIYDGVKYVTNIVETTTSLTALSTAACVKAGASAGCLGFQTEEGTATPAQFGIVISAIPEPVGVAGLGLGILSLMIVSRRRKNQA